MSVLFFIILKHAALVPLLIEMAFFQKLIKKRSENKTAQADSKENIGTEKKPIEDPKANIATKEPNKITSIFYGDSTDSTFTTDTCLDLTSSDSDSDEEDKKEVMLLEMRRQLKSMNRHQDKRRRRCADVMAIEAEIQELIGMISQCQLHNKALDEEILNKKCEIKFLQSEGPDDHEMHVHVKKNQPSLYKKYTSIKGSNEAKNILTVIRQSQRALQYLELMTYSRYLERQHGVHSDSVRKRNLHLKDKAKHFGHLLDSIHTKKLSLKKIEPRTSSPNKLTLEASPTAAGADSDSVTTHVTVSSSPTSSGTPSPFTFGFPLLAFHQNSTTANSVFGGTSSTSGSPRIPISPFETSL